MTVAQAQAVVDIVQSGLEASDQALDLYNKVLDQVIPWATFEQTIKELTRYEKDYSDESGQIVGKVKTLLLNSQDQYLKATQSVYEWCGIASNLLKAYITLFDDYDANKAAAQKSILLKVLGDGIVKMEEAQSSLQDSSTSFNNASGELSALKTRLENDFTQGSVYFEKQVSKIRKEAFASAAAGVVGGPFGLLISYGIAAGVVEGKLIPELKNKFEQIKTTFKKIKDTVSQAETDITAAKGKLQEEIRIIGEMKIKTEETQLYVQLDDTLLKLLKESARNLISKCEIYRKRHS